MALEKLGQWLGGWNRRLAWKVGRRLYMLARHEVPDRFNTNGEALLQEHILRIAQQRSVDAVILDVGANVGEWTRSLIRKAQAMVGRCSYVIHAFEPFPKTFETLCDNLRADIDRGTVRCNQLAISSDNGQTTLYGGANSGRSSLSADNTSSHRDSVSVATKTVDTYCHENEIKELHLLKCDAEGHDYYVLVGAGDLLKSGRVWCIQFEYNHSWVYSRHYLKDIFELIEGTSYHFAKLTPNAFEVYERWHPELERFFHGNYVLIRNDLLDDVPTRRLSVDAANTFA